MLAVITIKFCFHGKLNGQEIHLDFSLKKQFLMNVSLAKISVTDAATGKRQMNYFIERKRNIETADEMNEALQCANTLCGFNSCVIEILEKKKYEKQKHISSISKIQVIKYIYGGNSVSYKTWHYYVIGSGKFVTCGTEPSIPHHNVKSTFSNQCKSFRMVTTKQAKKESPESSFHCTDPMCVKIFCSYELLKNSLDFGKHEYEKMNTTQLVTVTEKWLKPYVEGNEKGNPREIANDEDMKYFR